jgi:prepilin-type processing-associated H-X9-DG protein
MTAELMYAADHDERLPPCLTWMDATQKYANHPDIFRCPERKKIKEGDYGHAMNVELSLALSTDFTKKSQGIPVLFDSVLLARNACSGFYGFPDPKENNTAVAYLDGHVSKVKK